MSCKPDIPGWLSKISWPAAATFVAALVALFREDLRRIFGLGPKLRLDFQTRSPWCTQFTSHDGSGVYTTTHYLRFRIENFGHSPAEDVELHLSRVLELDDQGNWRDSEDFLPMRLTWSDSDRPQWSSIAPKMEFYCDFATVNAEPWPAPPGVPSHPILQFTVEKGTSAKGVAVRPEARKLLGLQLGARNVRARPIWYEFNLYDRWPGQASIEGTVSMEDGPPQKPRTIAPAAAPPLPAAPSASNSSTQEPTPSGRTKVPGNSR
jgi:hypothetical protein